MASVGALDHVVACTKYCADVVPNLDVSRRLVIADSWSAKAGEILAAKPDLVIAAVPYQQDAVEEILKAGVRFLGLAPRTLEDIYTDIAMIAGCAGAGERASQVISDMQGQIEDVRRQTSGLPVKRVFCEEWGKPVIASQPWVAELVSSRRWRISAGSRACNVLRRKWLYRTRRLSSPHGVVQETGYHCGKLFRSADGPTLRRCGTRRSIASPMNF